MTKLLEAFIKNPTPKNAQKIKAYAAKHPMASCMLPAGAAAIVNEIIAAS